MNRKRTRGSREDAVITMYLATSPATTMARIEAVAVKRPTAKTVLDTRVGRRRVRELQHHKYCESWIKAKEWLISQAEHVAAYATRERERRIDALVFAKALKETT